MMFSNIGAEPMTLGSPTSPKPSVGAQFLPGFLMGDLPTPVTPQPRTLGGSSAGIMEMRSPLLAGKTTLNCNLHCGKSVCSGQSFE